jgi:cell division protein FtsN
MNNSPHISRQAQRGGFGLGIVAGLLIGLALALGVALYITKAPVPFVNKVPARTADQDNAEIERNRTWDPNAGLGGKVAGKPGTAAPPAASASAPVSTTGFPPPVPGQPPVVIPTAPAVAGAASAPGAKSAAVSARDAAAILSGSTAPPVQAGPAAATLVDPFIYFVQAGAYTRNEEAEQQRAKLALLGQQAKITEREQAGRTMYRVRVGPFPRREDADNLQIKLQEQSIESQIVRVEKP